MSRFASALGGYLAPSDGWKQSTTDLVPDLEATLFSSDTAAVMLVPGDGVKPGQFRTIIEGLVKKAKAPTSSKQPVPVVPWNALIVLLVFEQECSSDMRAFVGNERRPLGGTRFIQGGWVDLSSGEAEFRTNKTQLENDLLQAVKQAANDTSAPPSRGSAVEERGSRRGTRDLQPAYDEERPRKKSGGLMPLILGLLLIGGGGAGYWFMYGPGATPPAATASPAAVSPSAKAPDKKPSGKPVAGKSEAPKAAPSAAPSAAPAAPSAAPSAQASSAP